MKKITFLFVLMFTAVLAKAQDYQISFTGSGESTTVDSVYVENLTQGTTLELLGSDILNLVQTLSVVSQAGINKDIKIYPNPVKESSKIQFYNDQTDDVRINIYDVTGKLIAGQSGRVNAGTNVFEISGFPSGIYIVNIKTSVWQESLRIVSVGNKTQTPTIKSEKGFMSPTKVKSTSKSTSNIIQMQYNDGETLLFTIISGDYSRVITAIPTQTQIINSEFVSCTDPDGNNYAVVTIGNQTWMAENLAYLPEITFENDWASYYNPQYSVYDYAPGSGSETIAGAKVTANYNTYGVLYNWPAAMDGDASSSSNPSGVQGICPNGWHLPSDEEWKELEMALGMSQAEADGTGYRGTNEGSKLAGNTSLWNGGNLENDAEFGISGFSAIPGGFRNSSGGFGNFGDTGTYRSATEDDIIGAWVRGLYYDYSNVIRYDTGKEGGFSVRCVRD